MNPETEFDVWEKYLSQLINKYPTAPIYLKGGSVLGLECYTYIASKPEIHTDFTKLNLIKDWDFVIELENYDKKEFYAINPYIKKEGSSNLIIMRYLTPKQRLMIPSGALFELAVQYKTSLELPMTSMTLTITNNNLKDLFIIIKKIYLGEPIELSLIHPYISVDFCTSMGLFEHPLPFQSDLSIQILNIIKPVGPNTVYQFLIAQISQPCRFFLRLVELNINKSDRIKQFFITNKIDLPPWLLDSESIIKIKTIVWTELKLAIGAIYDTYAVALEPIYKSIDIINLKIDLLKYNDSFTNMINILTGLHSDTPNAYIESMINNCSKDQIHNKIIEFNIKNTKCQLYGVIESDMLVQNKKIRKNFIKKLIEEKVSCVDLELIYLKLFIDLADLFQGVNLGRLNDQINKFSRSTQLELVDLFERILSHIHLDYLPLATITKPYGKVIRLIYTLANIQSTSKTDYQVV